MPDISKYVGDVGAARQWADDVMSDAGRAQHYTDHVMDDKYVSIVIARVVGGTKTTLAAQTVRLEQTRIAPDINVGQGAREPRGNAIVIGFKDHPTIADTDILPGDKFVADNKRYEVRYLMPATPGRVEAWVETLE